MTEELKKRLKEETEAEIRFDPASREAWSSDASIFKILPLGIVFPKSENDVLSILKIASDLSIPVIPRGAATGITGGAIGRGLVIDVSKYLNQIHEIHFEEKWVEVEPGVILDDLNKKLFDHGYQLGPETSTSNRATIGGMAANNASGARALRFGKMSDHVQEVTLALAGGKKLHLKPLTEGEWENTLREDSPLGSAIRAAEMIQEKFSEEIKAKFPPLIKNVSGYNLPSLIESRYPNLAKVTIGSEGTLGIFTRLKLSIVKIPENRGLALIYFHDMAKALEAVPKILKWDCLALEIIDKTFLNFAYQAPPFKKGIGWIQGEPEAFLIAEFHSDSIKETHLKLSSFEADMRHHNIGYAYYLSINPEEIAQVWQMRRSGVGLLMSKRSYQNACAFIEDLAAPPENLAPFVKEIQALLNKEGLDVGIYGHVSTGCLHIRPYLNLTDPDQVKRIEPILKQATELVLRYKGAISGEHGDGFIRSWLNETFYGEDIVEAFQILKQAFDPKGIMNPGKIVNPPSLEAIEDDLRLNPKTPLNQVKTFLNFEKEGGFSLTADLCNGNALCRKEKGVMCPSFQATRSEFDSTRGRALVLQSMIHKTAGSINWNDKNVNQALDLCLQCKGCKTECPSQVDMSKLKIEFLYHYNWFNGLSIRTRLLSSFPRLLRMGASFPRFVNWLLNRDWVKAAQKALKLAPQRPPPPLAETRFSSWFSKNIQGKQTKGKQVVLFNDTYTEYFYPEVGKSAVKVLHALGYEVIVPTWHCCGRPLFSKGRLKLGQKKAKKLLDTLVPYITPKIPILGLEPSCLFTLLDEYQSLPDVDASELKSLCQTFDTFLQEHLEEGKLPFKFKKNSTQVKVFGHCHEKALQGMEATLDVLKAVPGFKVETIDSGCCGMAGSFGYEEEHYDLSMKIGELKLLPEVRKASKETLIVANGFSCRSQIAEGAGRSAIHLAEALDRVMD